MSSDAILATLLSHNIITTMISPPPSSSLLNTNSHLEYAEMNSQPAAAASGNTLSPQEIYRLRQLLQSPQRLAASSSKDDTDANSEYSEFPETTHAWAVFADKANRKATMMDRMVGTGIMAFQLFAYALFVEEAINDYQTRMVPVLTTHEQCAANNEQIVQGETTMECEAEVTNHFDAVVAFSMLAIFLTPEVLSALRALRNSWGDGSRSTTAFAALATFEVICAFLAAAVAISYQLYVGEVTDAIEVGVGLLFVRELSARAYQGIRHKGIKRYKAFFVTLAVLLMLGIVVEAVCENTFGRR